MVLLLLAASLTLSPASRSAPPPPPPKDPPGTPYICRYPDQFNDAKSFLSQNKTCASEWSYGSLCFTSDLVTLEVSNATDFLAALKDDRVQVIILTANIALNSWDASISIPRNLMIQGEGYPTQPRVLDLGGYQETDALILITKNVTVVFYWVYLNFRLLPDAMSPGMHASWGCTNLPCMA